MAASVRVVVADDQRIVREGLATILAHLPGIEVVGLAADGEEAVRLVGEGSCDVVLMDLRMPVLDGVRATATIRARFPRVQVVALTTYDDEETVLAALSAGAIGYLTKDAGRDDIHRALLAADAGQSLLGAGARARLLDAARLGDARPAPPTPDGLTAREVEVLVLIAEGLSNAQIAARLFVGEATVKTHINHIFAKTGSRDRAQAAAYARHHGLGE